MIFHFQYSLSLLSSLPHFSFNYFLTFLPSSHPTCRLLQHYSLLFLSSAIFNINLSRFPLRFFTSCCILLFSSLLLSSFFFYYFIPFLLPSSHPTCPLFQNISLLIHQHRFLTLFPLISPFTPRFYPACPLLPNPYLLSHLLPFFSLFFLISPLLPFLAPDSADIHFPTLLLPPHRHPLIDFPSGVMHLITAGVKLNEGRCVTA